MSGCLVLDGGLGTALETQGYTLDDTPMWSAALLATNPGALRDVHSAFLSAGADVITTATYQASVSGFVKLGYTIEEAYSFMTQAATLCNEAISMHREEMHESEAVEDMSGVDVLNETVKQTKLIAGSCGPYGAYLADRSEYTGMYSLPEDLVLEYHRCRLRALMDSQCVDYYLFETFPTIDEATMVLKMLREFPELRGKIWFSFCCSSGTQLSNGSPFRDNIGDLLLYDSNDKYIDGIGVNCCMPQYISSLLCSPPLREDIQNSKTTKIRNLNELRIVAYPEHLTNTTDDAAYAEEVLPLSRRWLKSGVDVIGGCCGTSPSNITMLRTALYDELRNEWSCTV